LNLGPSDYERDSIVLAPPQPAITRGMTVLPKALHGWKGVPPCSGNKIRVWMDREGTPDWFPSKVEG